MCIAVPGKVISIEGSKGNVDFDGFVMEVNLTLVDAVSGDYVLVHAGCAIETLQEDRAKELVCIFQQLEEFLNENEH